MKCGTSGGFGGVLIAAGALLLRGWDVAAGPIAAGAPLLRSENLPENIGALLRNLNE